MSLTLIEVNIVILWFQINSSCRWIPIPHYSVNSKSFPSLTKFCPALYLGQSLPRLDSLISWIHPLSYTRRSRSPSSWFTWRYSSWRYTWSCRTISGPSSTLTNIQLTWRYTWSYRTISEPSITWTLYS